MFYRFSAAPVKARSQTKGSSNTNKNENTGNDCDADCSPRANPGQDQEPTILPLAKRQKTARACDRCRLHRIKCDEQKPCAQCVGIKTKCIVSYVPPRASQQYNNISNTDGINDTNYTKCKSSTSSVRHDFDNGSRGCCHSARASIATIDSTSTGTGSSTANSSPIISPAVPSSRTSMNMSVNQENTWMAGTSLVGRMAKSKQSSNLSDPLQGYSAFGQSEFPHTSSTSCGSLFPQLPHPAMPVGERTLPSTVLLKSQRSYYLRLFWDVCHPLVSIMSDSEFAELDALPASSPFDERSARTSLVDCMIALGVQHCHATGLNGRILGLRQPSPSQHFYPAATPMPETTWPGFEYFSGCRESMRINTEATMDGLRSHILMVIYLMKGNAFCDAYNLLGITVRKAYIAKLHRVPPSHLPEVERTGRMQLWSTLFALDVQCSLQLDMPTAIQKSLVKCPFPTEDILGHYTSPSSHHAKGTTAYAYSIRLAKLAVIVADINTRVSPADLDDDTNGDSNSSAALEHHALNLSPALQNLETWHAQLPSGLLLSRSTHGPGNAEMLDFNRDSTLPAWLQRQAVLLELHYHNAYTLIQRPFIRFHYSCSKNDNVTLPHSQQPHIELHINSALHHASAIIDTVFTVCSTSDVLYGWSEVLQPLWNATLTIIAHASAYNNSLSSTAPNSIDSLTRARAVFDSFAPTCPTAHSAKNVVQSLTGNLQDTAVQGSCVLTANDDSMRWDFLTLMLEEPQTSTAAPVLDGLPSASTADLTTNALFPPFTPSAAQLNTHDFNPMPMHFGNS